MSKPVAPQAARVLVVDDDATSARNLCRALHEHDVIVVADPREARDRVARGERFDVLISDLMMPQMSGAQLHEELTRLAPDQAERVLFVTGGATSPEAQDFLEATRRPVLMKPVSIEDLRTTVLRILSDRGRDG